MKRSGWRVVALGALMGAVALPASAQVVIGGSGAPSVEVNWSVLDELGRQPTLADMLKSEPPAETRAAPGNTRKPQAGGVQYRPYKPGATPYANGKPPAAKPAKPAKAPAAKPPRKPPVVPASAKSSPVADLVQSAHRPAPAEAPRTAAQPAVPPKPQVTPVADLPKVNLPEAPKVEAPKVAAAEAPKVEAPKVEAPKVEAPKVAAVEVPKVEAPKVAAVEAPKVEAPKVDMAKAATPPAIGPQIALPVAPKPAPAPVAPPVQMAKAEAPVTLPPTALTPPPLPVAKVEAPVEPAPQVASVPVNPAPAAAAVAALHGSDTLSVPFTVDSARLPESAHANLDRLAKRMLKDEGLGLQLLAYADGDDANASKARRLSLSRALEVRKYLMEQGLRSTRIEVRALGNKIEGGGTADRVDAVLVGR